MQTAEGCPCFVAHPPTLYLIKDTDATNQGYGPPPVRGVLWVFTYPGHWCPASAQLCEHACHLGFEMTCDDSHRRLRLSLVIQEVPPFLSYPPILLSSLSHFSLSHGHPHTGIDLPTASHPPVSGKKGALVENKAGGGRSSFVEIGAEHDV